MNLLIVFAFAGDSTMTRFLAIVERPTFHVDVGIPRACMMRARTRGAGLIEARTIAPRRQEGEKGYRMWSLRRLILLLPRLRRRPLCTFSSCCRASCTRCPGSRRSCGGGPAVLGGGLCC